MLQQRLCAGVQVRFALLFRRAGAMVAFWFVAGMLASSSALAAERQILGPTSAVPLAANADPVVTRSLIALKTKVAQKTTVRVIVGLRVPFAAEGLIGAAQSLQQRSEIATAHTALLSKVPSLGRKPNATKKFETIPFMALEVDAKELEALAALADVTSIQEDRLAMASLAESVPLAGGTTAWASGYTGAGRTVAVLDTGVDKTHPFLTGKVVTEACYSTTYSDSATQATSVCPGGVLSSTAAGAAMPYAGVCPAGECDHGTHVAGIVAGSNSSFSGVAKDASLIAVQVFSRFDGADSCNGATSCALSFTSDQILGLERVYALRTTHNIDAVNMSLGGGYYPSQNLCDADNTDIKTIIDNLRSVNIATVIASGNNGYADGMSAPGCVSSAISVGATWDVSYPSGIDCTDNPPPSNFIDYGGADKVACFSNSTSFLSLLAPGIWINSSIPGAAYDNYAGTSMATPHVAGAWSLLRQKAPIATVDEILAALASSGVSVADSRNGITKPRINLPAALSALTPGVPYTLSVATTGAGAGVVISSPAGINCGPTCSASFVSGAVVTLTASPSSGSLFTDWSGGCTGTGYCSVTMSTTQSVTANFAVGVTTTPLNRRNLTGTAGSYQTFSVMVPAGAANLVIRTSGGTGDVDLYVRASAAPTLWTYDCRPWLSGNDETCTFGAPQATTYQIMLRGYAAYSGVTLTASYTTAATTNPGVLNFTSTNLTVAENAGSAIATVSRTGGSDGAASVTYSTSPGTAVPGVDYTTVVGNLTWASGDASSKTISIPITDNAVVNSSERSFVISLTSVSGGDLGSANVVTVNISDDENNSTKFISEIIYLLLLSD